MGIHSHLVHLDNHTTWSHLRRSKTSHKSTVHIGTGIVRSTGLQEGCYGECRGLLLQVCGSSYVSYRKTCNEVGNCFPIEVMTQSFSMGICGPTQIKICLNCTHVNYKLQSTTNDHFVQFCGFSI